MFIFLVFYNYYYYKKKILTKFQRLIVKEDLSIYTIFNPCEFPQPLNLKVSSQKLEE
jgi:hypothetical protein